MGRLLLGIVAALLALVVVGVLALKVFSALLGVFFYLLVGAAVVGGGAYLYYRAKRAVGPGTRTRNRLDAASWTYRERNR
jgi:hypothetical protein